MKNEQNLNLSYNQWFYPKDDSILILSKHIKLYFLYNIRNWLKLKIMINYKMDKNIVNFIIFSKIKYKLSS